MRTLARPDGFAAHQPLQHRHPGPRPGAAPTRWRRGWRSCRWSADAITLDSFVPDGPARQAGGDRRRRQHPQRHAGRRAPPPQPVDRRRPPAGRRHRARPDCEQAAREAAARLDRWPASPRRCAHWRRRPDATLLAANAALTRFLPLQLDRLRTALDAHPVTAGRHPGRYRPRLALPDGRARVQVTAKPQAPRFGGAARLRRRGAQRRARRRRLGGDHRRERRHHRRRLPLGRAAGAGGDRGHPGAGAARACATSRW